MASRTVIVLTDDLDGQPADTTTLVGLDGTYVELDLTTEHARELAELLEPYLAAGRRVRPPLGGKPMPRRLRPA